MMRSTLPILLLVPDDDENIPDSDLSRSRIIAMIKHSGPSPGKPLGHPGFGVPLPDDEPSQKSAQAPPAIAAPPP